MIRKFLPLDLSKLKQPDADGAAKFAGYLSAFNNEDSYKDIILPGAFSETLKNRTWPVQLFYNHRLGAIGKYNELGEDEYGLKFDAELTPGHSTANDVRAGLRHGSIRGMSIGFMPIKGGWVSRDPEDDPRGWTAGRVYSRVELLEGSVVDMPANVLAEIEEVRNGVLSPSALAEALEDVSTIRDIEGVLRESAGLSRRAVEMLTARLKTVLETPLRTELEASQKIVAEMRKERELRVFAERLSSIATK